MLYTLNLKPANEYEWDVTLKVAQATGIYPDNILLHLQDGLISIPFTSPVTLARFAQLLGSILLDEDES